MEVPCNGIRVLGVNWRSVGGEACGSGRRRRARATMKRGATRGGEAALGGGDAGGEGVPGSKASRRPSIGVVGYIAMARRDWLVQPPQAADFDVSYAPRNAWRCASPADTALSPDAPGSTALPPSLGFASTRESRAAARPMHAAPPRSTDAPKVVRGDGSAAQLAMYARAQTHELSSCAGPPRHVHR